MNIVRTFEAAREALADETVVALDLETTGFSPWKTNIAVIALYGPSSKTAAVLHYPRGHRVPLEVMRWLERFPLIVTHNGAQFDILFLANNGMRHEMTRWYDTMIGEQAVITSGRRTVRVNLKDSVKRRFGKELEKNIDHGSWGNETLDETQMDYVTGDITFLVDMMRKQMARASESSDMARALQFEMDLIPAIVTMEMNGLPINMAALDKYISSQAPKLEAASDWIKAQIGDINLASVPQLRKALQTKYGEAMFPDTKAERFMEYAILGGEVGEMAEHLMLFRNADQRRKMFSNRWVDEFVVDHGDSHRVHGKFWQVGTETGRMSSSQPNLQQVPKDMRWVYGGHEGHAVGKTDYAAIEVRVAAALAPDFDMIEAFETGDIHRVVGAAGFNKPEAEITKEERQIAKAMSFTLLFGGGAETFRAYAANNGSSVTRADADLILERFFNRFRGIAAMRRSAMAKAGAQRPVTLLYPTGLKRVLWGDTLRPTVLLNNIVQGTAAAGIKKALMLCHERGLTQWICAIVHDEIVYTAPWAKIEEVAHEIERAMVDGMEWALKGCPPIAIAVESTWGESWAGDPANEHRYSRRVNEPAAALKGRDEINVAR